VQERINSRAI